MEHLPLHSPPTQLPPPSLGFGPWGTEAGARKGKGEEGGGRARRAPAREAMTGVVVIELN